MFDVKINKEKTVYASFRHEKHAREWAREQSSHDSIHYHVRDRRPPVTREIAHYYRGEDVMAPPTPPAVEHVDILSYGTVSAKDNAEWERRDRLQELTPDEKTLAKMNYLDAIKAVRARTGCTLGAAKRSVDIVRDA